MEEEGSVSVDPLFVGLTRPAMFLGVPHTYFVVNFFISIIFFINLDSKLKSVLAAAIIHLIGYLLAFKDPRFMDLFTVKSKKCNKCKNKFYHGANSYDPF